MGTGTVPIKPIKVKGVQFFSKSVLLKPLSFCFCAPGAFELGNSLFFSFFRLLD